MHRFLFLLLLLSSAELSAPASVAAQSESAAASTAEGLPARPSPFRFVTDEAKLLSPADAKTLESGLRRYADNTGTQIVVVTVPTLGGRTVADYGRALGQAWGVGQREKNNGIVVLLSGQERKVTIQPGSGLQSVITPEVTARVINDQMTPSFKQGKYFAGIRTGLNTLMLAANPESNPNKNQPATTTAPATASGAAAGTGAAASSSNLNTDGLASTDNTPASEPFTPQSTVPAPQSSGLGIGTLAIGALLIGGVIWVLVRLFRRKSQAAAVPGNAPDFYGNGNLPNNPTGNYNRGNVPPQQQGPDFYGNRGPNMGGNGYGGGMGNSMGGGMGSGMGGILATGAAAAAGAYLGNRMASGGHDESGNSMMGHNGAPSSLDPGATGLAGAAGTAGGASSADEFPAFGGASTNDAAPDYFSQDDSNNSSPDYFSSDDNSSYDDMSSDDTGGGGFDSDDDNSGSW
ncbi:TPM domain-containing protein [Hymenobacter volaticus]|uniref:TPM domain-containing protein n=1 Tax=Hymenobacter volaticus TaxID=2932254 RepID=A0ABY4G5I0_9BACT|nr:TPM domain-containing protein [Hymenobacter volaticus]UOQ66160.1 TPM domain-containing protein [Hymenobacter volaticus]